MLATTPQTFKICVLLKDY